MAGIELRSPDFDDQAFIPERHSHDADNVSPSLEWMGVPSEAVELLLLCEDPDAPGDAAFLHWLVTGIDPHTGGVPERGEPAGGQMWPNDFGETGWGGPAPPPGTPHRYIVSLYALGGHVELPQRPTVDDVHRAAEAVELGHATLVGRYGR